MKPKKIKLSEIRLAAPRRPDGYEAAILACAQERTDEYVILSDADYFALRKQYAPANPGPGTELKALLKTIGIVAKPNCSCNKRARVMDEKGCDWCEEHIDEIDGWLAEEAKKRKLPYISLAGKTLVRLAIRRARKKGNSR
jgi:hypothetical protein